MDDEPKPKPKRRKVRRVRRPRRRFGMWMLLSIVFLTGLMVLAGLSVSGRSINAPDWMTIQAERRINQNMPTGRVSLGRIALNVDDRGVPRLSLHNIGIFDGRGAEIARLNEVGAKVSLRSLTQGKIQIETLRLSGAQMTLRRLRDGQFDLSFGGGGGGGATGTLPGLLDAIDDAFATAPLANVQQLEAQALTITVEDGRSGRLWQVTEGSLQLKNETDGLDVAVSFDVFNGTEELARTVLGIRTDRTSAAASFGASFENAAATDIALQSPVLSFLGVLDAPISGAVRADFTSDGDLSGLAGTLEIASGALRPSSATKPVGFDAAKAYFSFDPSEDKLQFSEVSVQSGAFSVVSSGHAYLRDFQEGWPSTMLGQLSLSDLVAKPEGLFDEPVEFSQGAFDFRLQLNPFTVDIGQLVLKQDQERLLAKGRVAAGAAGWEVATDIQINEISHDRLLRLWPVSFVPKTRNWILTNVTAGLMTGVHGALRSQAGAKTRLSVGYQFRDATVTYIKSLPPILGASGYSGIDGKTFSLVLENGHVNAPSGGDIDMSGSTMRIADITRIPARAEFDLHGLSSTTAALSLLNEPPFRVLRNSKYPVDVAEGVAEFDAKVAFDLKRKVLLPDVSYGVQAELRQLSSQKLVANKTVTGDLLALKASPVAVEISGPIKVGDVPADILWTQKLGPDQVGRSTIEGTVELSQGFLDEFQIGLPKGTVVGRGIGQFELLMTKDAPPQFSLNSDLNRMGLNIAALGWSKPRNATGKLVVEGHLATPSGVDRLELSAAGLNASGGRVVINEEGGLKEATFSRVTAGGWLDAPVTLTGRGANVAPSVALRGGSIDVRRTTFGEGTSGNGGPINLALDRLVVSEGIVLTDFEAALNSASGLSGSFNARVNGKARITGQLEAERRGTAIRMRAKNAGAVLRSAGVFEDAKGGSFDLTLRPLGQRGVYNGRLLVNDTRVVDAPALTELLSLISIVGLIDQVNGPGISFTDVQADFRLTPSAITLTKSSAVGPSLGLSLDGVYDLASSSMVMQGVLSPVYFLNGVGQIFSRRGEGLFGFTFDLTGSADDPIVDVNPLSILTPGMFREIFRAPPPVPTQ